MTITTRSDLDGMRRTGRVVALALRAMEQAARPGMTTAELDAVGAALLAGHGARSAPQLAYGFPGVTCISVNEEAVHGVPGSRVLKPGDVVKIDVTAELEGYIADAAVTVLLPPVSSRAHRLRDCVQRALALALEAARAGNAVAELGRAVEAEVARRGFSVIRELTGHGVGRALHEKPAVPNFYSRWTAGTLREGLVLAVEPIVSAEPARVVQEADGWTIRTHNRCLAAHCEHTVMITRGAPVMLTVA